MKSREIYSWIENYCKQRDEAVIQAVKYGNLEPLKELARRNGMYIPKDEVLIISAHKMCYNITTMPKDLQKKSEKWLTERGYSVQIF